MQGKAPALSVVSDYPTKPVRLIEPFGAGGGVGVLAGVVADKLSELWGQPVTVENHPGGGSTAAPALVAKSPADGCTLLVNDRGGRLPVPGAATSRHRRARARLQGTS